MWRKLFKYLALAVLAMIAVLALLLISPPLLAPAVQPVRMMLVHGLLETVSDSLDGGLEVDDLSGSLLSAPVIRGLRIVDSDGTPLVQVDEIRLGYQLAALIKGRLQIDQIAVVRPRADLKQDENGQLNLAAVFAPLMSGEPPPDDAPLALQLALEHLELTEGHLDLDLPALTTVHTVDGLELALAAALDRTGLRLDLETLTARTQPAGVNLVQGQGSISVIDGQVRFSDWVLATDTSRLTLSGAFPSDPVDNGPRLELQPLDFTEIGRLLGDERLIGNVTGALQVSGDIPDLHLDGALNLEGGELSLDGRFDLASARKTFEGEVLLANLNPRKLFAMDTLAGDLNARFSFQGAASRLQDLSGTAELDILPSSLGEVDLEPSRARISAQSESFQIDQLDLNSSVLTASGGGGIHLSGHSDLHYRIDADLDQLQTLLGLDRLDGDIGLTGTVRGTWPELVADGALKARDLAYGETTLKTANVSFDAEHLGTEPFVTAALEIGQAQSGDLLFDGAELQAQYTRSGATHDAHFQAQLAQSDTLSALLEGGFNGQGQIVRLELDTLQVQIQDHEWINETPLEVSLSPNQYVIAPFRLRHGEEQIGLSGALAGDRLDGLDLEITSLDLDFLRTLLALPPQLGGRADLALNAAGSLAQPRFELRIDVQRTDTPGEVPWERIQLNSEYAQQSLTLSAKMDQRAHRAIELDAALPANLALVELPLEQRLIDQPVALALTIQRLDLSELTESMTPAADGMLSGKLSLTGDYSQLALDGDISLSGGQIPAVGDQINAELNLTARLLAANSVDALRDAIRDNRVSAEVPELVLTIPELSLMRPEFPGPEPVEIHDLELAANGNWRTDDWRVAVTHFGLQTKVPGYPQAALSMAAALTPQLLLIEQLEASTAESALAAQGRYAPPDGSMDLTLDIGALELRDLLADLPPDLPSLLSGAIHVTGSADNPVMNAELEYANARIGADADAQLAELPPRYSSQLRIEGLDLSRFPSPTTGTVNATLRLDGSGFSETERAAALLLDLDTVDLSALPGLTAALRANLAGTALTVDGLDVISSPITLRANGVLSQDSTSDLRYTVTLQDLSPLQSMLGVPIEARGGIEGQVSGDPDALRSASDIRLENWRYGEWRGGSVKGQLALTDLSASPTAELSLTLSGLEGPGLPPSALALAAGYAQNGGTLSLNVDQGPFADSRIDGRFDLEQGVQATLDVLRLQHGNWVWENKGAASLGSDATGSWIRDLALINGSQELSLTAALSADGALSGRMRMDRLDVGGAVDHFAPQDEPIKGIVSADLTLGGSVKQPRVDGDLEATGLAQGDYDLGDVRAEVSTEGETIQGVARWLFQQEPVLTASGGWNAARPDDLNLQLRADSLDLGRLQPLSNEILASGGSLDLDLRLDGSLERPELFGNLNIDDGELQLAPLGERFTQIQSRLVFDGTRIVIEQLEAQSQTGPAQVSGEIRLQDLAIGQVDLALRSENFTVMSTPAIGAVLSTRIDVRGNQDDMEVTGEVVVNRANFRYEALPAGGPATVEPWELTVEGVYGSGPPIDSPADGGTDTPVPGNRSAPPPLPFLRADVTIDMPRNIWVQGSGTAIELSGKLAVTKALRKPIIVSGKIDTTRGFATLLGRRFNVDTGQVIFTGTPDINPVLNVLAAHRVSDYTVYVEVTGESSEPDIAFRSEPELDESDVMSLLIFGRTSEKLSSSEQGSLSGALASGVASTLLENTLGRTLGVDTVTVDLTDPDESTFGVGQYLSDDLFLSYDRTFRDPKRGNTGGSTFGLEFHITPRFRVRGTGSDFGETAIDFIWGFDY